MYWRGIRGQHHQLQRRTTRRTLEAGDWTSQGQCETLLPDRCVCPPQMTSGNQRPSGWGSSPSGNVLPRGCSVCSQSRSTANRSQTWGLGSRRHRVPATYPVNKVRQMSLRYLDAICQPSRMASDINIPAATIHKRELLRNLPGDTLESSNNSNSNSSNK